jgi:molybdenum cofactor synthesis domain-containing protein
MQKKQVTAGIIIIGNEILSGRTQDLNINFLANSLSDIAIDLIEVRVVKDIESNIIDAVNQLREKYNYVITSGGIGPTHDDITTSSIAKALGLKVVRDITAQKILENYYPKEKLNDARLKMADIPDGAELLDNPVSAAPGYKIQNIFVFAGVPRIMQAMFHAAKEFMQPGMKVYSKSISVFITEGDIAKDLTKLQVNFPDVEIGSYPYIKNERLGTSLVFRSIDQHKLNECYHLMQDFLNSKKIEIDAC